MSAADDGFQPVKFAMNVLPGTMLAGVVAMAATLVSMLHGGPQLLYALFFGVAFHYLSTDLKAKPGIEFCSRNVLRLGVGLLGARITATQIASLGWSTAAIVIAAVITTLLVGYFLGKRLGLDRSQGVLSGGAVAICGASAALAISSVLPRTKESERFTLMVVVRPERRSAAETTKDTGHHSRIAPRSSVGPPRHAALAPMALAAASRVIGLSHRSHGSGCARLRSG